MKKEHEAQVKKLREEHQFDYKRLKDDLDLQKKIQEIERNKLVQTLQSQIREMEDQYRLDIQNWHDKLKDVEVKKKEFQT